MPRDRIIDHVHRGVVREDPSSFWYLLSGILARVFGEIADERELLEQCYSSIRARDFDEEFIAEITTMIPSALLFGRQFDYDLERFMNQDLLGEYAPRAYVIVGDVGTGKSTYLHHYFKVTVKERNLADLLEGIIVDLRGTIDNPRDLGRFVHDKIYDYLTAEHADISSPDLDQAEELFKPELLPLLGVWREGEAKLGRKAIDQRRYRQIEGLLKDKVQFNKARMRFLREHGKRRLFIVLDNVDHFQRRFQENAFYLSMQLMDVYQCPIILSSREYTLPVIFRHIPLAAYEPRFLHLAVPDVKDMIHRRVRYVLNSRSVERIFDRIGARTAETVGPSGKRYVFSRDGIVSDLEDVLHSLLLDDIVEMVTKLADYDLRAILKLIRVALSSGYLFPEERQHWGSVRRYDFLRAIMLGNNQYFYPDDPSCNVLNLYDNDEPDDERNNLVRIRTLQTAAILGSYAQTDRIFSLLQTMGYPRDATRRILRLFLETDLIESPFSERPGFDEIRHVRLTKAGDYYLNTLLFDVTYMETVKHATYIDEEYQGMMEEFMKMGNTPAERRKFRLDATEVFIEAIRKEEKSEEERIRHHGNFKGINFYRKLPKVSAKMTKSFQEAKARILASDVSER